MPTLTEPGRQTIDALARRYGVSNDAVTTLIRALTSGNGSMAQFRHPELGGAGQWMRGGMTMIGDMFNQGLKARVDGLCNELAGLLTDQPSLASAGAPEGQGQGGLPPVRGGSGSWWPDGLGSPNSSGGQNDVRYAYFAGKHRLAVEADGRVTLYDTGDHQINGVSQQQGSTRSLTFTSQHGTVDLDSLPVVSG